MTMGTSETQNPYSRVKTSVWWDIEDCPVPKGVDANLIGHNIHSALVKMNYCGPISISAYGDIKHITSDVQDALHDTAISLQHFSAGVKGRIMQEIMFWVMENPAPANIILISGSSLGRAFSYALHQLRKREYNIFLAHPQTTSAATSAVAETVWTWTSLANGVAETTELTNTAPI